MKIKFDEKSGVPKFSLEEKDLKDAREIQIMCATKGWKILQDYLAVGRESLLEAGKDGIRSRAKVDLSPYKWALLKGWDECSAIPLRIISRAEEFRDQERASKEEAKNAKQIEEGEPI